MKKITFLLSLISLLSITGLNQTYGFSIVRHPTNSDRYEAAKSLNITSIIQLSAKQFSELTGKKMNMWDKVSFSIIKIKMKHDLKKNSNLTLNDYYDNGPKKRWGTVTWILVILLALLIIPILVIFSLGP